MKTKIIVTIFISILMSGCSAGDGIPLSTLPADSSKSPLATLTEIPLTIMPNTFPATPVTESPLLPSTKQPDMQYEYLSPLAIKKDNIIIEVSSYTIADSTFRFGINITGLSPAQIPETSPEYTFSPVVGTDFFYGDEQIPLELELFGGGGGGGINEDGTITISQDFSYKLLSPLPLRQKQYITVYVTLHETFGITEPVRFDLEIIPVEEIQG